MGQFKNKMMEEEEERAARHQNQMEGYRIKLEREKTYVMDCPNCGGALSKKDSLKESCIHCKFELKMNIEE